MVIADPKELSAGSRTMRHQPPMAHGLSNMHQHAAIVVRMYFWQFIPLPRTGEQGPPCWALEAPPSRPIAVGLSVRDDQLVRGQLWVSQGSLNVRISPYAYG